MTAILIDEATVKLVLDALETYKGFIDDAHILEGQWHWLDGLDNVQTSLREALTSVPDWASGAIEQPAPVAKPHEQEPVAYLSEGGNFSFEPWQRSIPLCTSPQAAQQEPRYKEKCADGSRCLHGCLSSEGCYTTPQPAPVAKPHEQEPDYHLKQYGDVTKEQLDRYMATGDINPQPAQRKPLDAGEISRLWKQHTNEDGPHHNPYDDDGLGFAQAIEAAHNIKENT